MAHDVIGIWGISEQADGRIIPKPSTSEPPHEANELVSWVDIDCEKYRKANDLSTMRIIVSVPKYLKVLSDEAGINFFLTLQKALKQQLDIRE